MPAANLAKAETALSKEIAYLSHLLIREIDDRFVDEAAARRIATTFASVSLACFLIDPRSNVP
jgi:hypothetical protein